MTIKEDEKGRACSTNGEMTANKTLVENPEGRGQPGSSKRRWMDNIRLDLGEIGWGGVDWIGPTQDRDKWRALVNGVIKCWEVLEQLHNWRRVKNAELHKLP
jgi:hypothetical protein